MGEIQTHVTSLSGVLGLNVAKHVILDLSLGQESFTMWLGLKLETAKLLPLRNKLVRIFQNVRLNLMVALMIHFFEPDELAGFHSTWNNKGLVSKSLTKETDDSVSNPKSYLYAGNSGPKDTNPSSYNYNSAGSSQVDPYSDPYNKYNGYTKQKGYPPMDNHPSSSRYNPYKDMGQPSIIIKV